MALLPVESQRISYVPEDLLKHLPDYELPEECAVPGCDFAAFDAHHVVRRSYTQGIGPQKWIAIDGRPYPNLVGLCRGHHSDVENNKTLIEYKAGRFFWTVKSSGFTAPLFPVPLNEAGSVSPPESEQHADAPSGASLVERDARGDVRDGELPSRSQASEGGNPAAQDATYGASVAPPSSEKCLACGRKLPKPKDELQPERPKQTWSIKVPVDARENGYALLRDLVEQCQHDLGREGEPPYYTLVEVFYAFLTSAKERAA